ncbi:MAG: hypothetical protein QNJ72_27885 [Pleurocapsa sp. MO_226.B13]|nr:hypothetical protein [Pleurocapsa sp. MO_226.B13]
MIFLFTGNDKTLIQEQIKYILKSHELNKYHTSSEPQQADLECLNRNLISPRTATLLETSQRDLKLDLKLIPRLVKSPNLLLIVSQSWDNRTKVGQALKPYLVSHADLPSNCHKKEIERGIDFYAGQLGLNLSFEVKEYLRLALNNNFPMLRSGLSTVALLSTNPTLDLVRQVIPSEYATAIELKEMILHKRRGEIPAYLTKLKSHVPDKVVLASLRTQFNLLLQTAIALKQNLNDKDIAKLAGIGNVKRLYFLRQELEQISIEQLIWLNRLIEDTQRRLQYNTCDLAARLMLMCCY